FCAKAYNPYVAYSIDLISTMAFSPSVASLDVRSKKDPSQEDRNIIVTTSSVSFFIVFVSNMAICVKSQYLFLRQSFCFWAFLMLAARKYFAQDQTANDHL